ncbi:MAG: hypothetical protein GY795_26040 [Desulfobacterales bacterium]|nr:hypothetical protein [Desulfobacterales bacterium]
MENGSMYIQLVASAIRIFADDGTIDKDELYYLLNTTLEHGQIDNDDEKKVLRNIFEKVPSSISPNVKRKINYIREKHSI